MTRWRIISEIKVDRGIHYEIEVGRKTIKIFITHFYEYEEKIPVLVTVYFPYARRYFEGGGNFEDKIL